MDRPSRRAAPARAAGGDAGHTRRAARRRRSGAKRPRMERQGVEQWRTTRRPVWRAASGTSTARVRSATLVPALTRPAFRRRAPAAAQVFADWAGIVGPGLAAVTTPRQLQGGTLVVACAGPVAMELQHLSVELLSRINRHLGGRTVGRLRFVQDVRTAPVPRAAAEPSPAARTAAERAASAVPPARCATRWPHSVASSLPPRHRRAEPA